MVLTLDGSSELGAHVWNKADLFIMNFKFATSVILKASALGKPQKSSFFSGKGAPSNLVAKRTFFLS